MPDMNYMLLEKWILPIMKQMLMEQNSQVSGQFYIVLMVHNYNNIIIIIMIE